MKTASYPGSRVGAGLAAAGRFPPRKRGSQPSARIPHGRRLMVNCPRGEAVKPSLYGNSKGRVGPHGLRGATPSRRGQRLFCRQLVQLPGDQDAEARAISCTC